MLIRGVRNVSLAVVALLGVTAFGTASAAIPDPSGKINACYNVAMHNFRLVDPASTSPFPDEKACTSNETAIAWGQTGPQGAQGPKGDTGAQGPQGPKGDQGPRGNSFARMLGPVPSVIIDDVEYKDVANWHLDPAEGPYTISVKFFIGGNINGNNAGDCALFVAGNNVDEAIFSIDSTNGVSFLDGTMIGVSNGGSLQVKCHRYPNTRSFNIGSMKALVTAVGSLR